MRIVLASQSPRRRELLSKAGYNFEVILPDESAEDGQRVGESVSDMVARLALQKALNVRPRIVGKATVVACDTVAELHGEVLGKPVDRQHARAMLSSLSGQLHRVFSGLCVLSMPEGQPQVRVAVSELLMENLTEAEIENYLDSDQWRGKAGAFGYQDEITWLKLLSGTASNVVGLPMDLLQEMLSVDDSRS